MKTHKESSSKSKAFVRPILIGWIAGGVACLLALLIMAAIMATKDVPQTAILPLAVIAAAFGALISGFTAAKLVGQNGWLIGAICAALLFLLTGICGFGLYGQLDIGFMLLKFGVMLACGVIGGVAAVNLGKRKR